MKTLQLWGYILVIILILNVVLFSFRFITPLIFWMVILLGAVAAYMVIPWLKKRVIGGSK